MRMQAAGKPLLPLFLPITNYSWFRCPVLSVDMILVLYRQHDSTRLDSTRLDFTRLDYDSNNNVAVVVLVESSRVESNRVE